MNIKKIKKKRLKNVTKDQNLQPCNLIIEQRQNSVAL